MDSSVVLSVDPSTETSADFHGSFDGSVHGVSMDVHRFLWTPMETLVDVHGNARGKLVKNQVMRALV